MRQAAQKVEAVEWLEAERPGREGCDVGAAARGAGRSMASANRQMTAGEPRCGREQRLLDWVESQASVTRIWLDQLIAEGDPQDLVSLIHRQAAWLDLMRSRLAES